MCRSVSKELRAVIDGRGLLLGVEQRVPRGLRGFFINYTGQDQPYFFSRPERAAPRIDAELSFLPQIVWRDAVHQTNGLLLVRDGEKLYVCNPATRRWAQLPQHPDGFGHAAYLVFDPIVSLHYEVISFSNVPRKPKIPIQPDIKRPEWYKGSSEYASEEIEKLPLSLRAKYDREAEIKGLIEWPPSSYMAHVFSSRTGQWEERAYVRGDDVAVTLWDVWSDPWTLEYNAPRCGAVYWRGALYLLCRGGFVMRLSFQEHKYQVIKTPKLDNVFTQPRLDIDDFLRLEGPGFDKEDCLRYFQREQHLLDSVKPSMHIGKSEHGIYYTALRWHQLQVWVLHESSESCPMPEWELKHKADIRPSVLQYYTREDREEIENRWSLDRGEEGSDDDQVYYGWDSSDDNEEGEDIVHSDDIYYNMSRCMDMLGFHPSKEIAFLGDHFEGFAYYLNSSKLQYLGSFDPVGCCHHLVAATHESFIYTPCMEDLLLNHERTIAHGGDQEEEEEEEEDIDEDLEKVEDEVVDTDEGEDLEEEEQDIDEDLEEVEDEDLKGLEEDVYNDEYEDS